MSENRFRELFPSLECIAIGGSDPTDKASEFTGKVIAVEDYRDFTYKEGTTIVCQPTVPIR